MSDTPRTDFQAGWAVSDGGVVKAEYLYADTKGVFVLAAFARELERELAEEKYQHHLTRGVADLAIKHRDEAERENARLREAGKSLRDEIAELEKRVCELADLRDEAVAANTRHVKLVLGARKRIDAALNALWETHGNGFGTPIEGPIAELQTALDETA